MAEADELRDDAEIESRRSWFAQITVGVLAVVCLGFGLRYAWSAWPAADTSESTDAPDLAVPLDGPDHAARDNAAAAAEGLVDLEPRFLLDSSPLISQEVNRDLALGLDAVIGWSTYEQGSQLIDLSTGVVSTIDDQQLLAITADYLVLTAIEVDPTDDVDTPLIVIDRSDGMVRDLESVASDVVYAVRGANPNDVWLMNVNGEGFSYRLLSLEDGVVVAEIASTEVLLRERPGLEPYAVHDAVGAFEIVDGRLEFLGHGNLVAASRTTELWSTCADSMECATTLRSPAGDTVVDVEPLNVGWWLGESARLSDDGRFVATVDLWRSGGLSVFDATIGESTMFNTVDAWSAAQVSFVDEMLVAPGSGELVMIDPATGETASIALTLGSIDERLITGPRFVGTER